MQRNEPEMHWERTLTNWMMGRMPTFGLLVYSVRDVQKGYKSLMILMENIKCCIMKTRPRHHHHHINERTERTKNGPIGMVDILCLWSVLMDVMRSLSVGRQFGTLFFQSHFPGKLVWPWSADTTCYGTVLFGELNSDMMICLSVLYQCQIEFNSMALIYWRFSWL